MSRQCFVINAASTQAEWRRPMERWNELIETLFEGWDREINDAGALRGIKQKIADAKAEAGRNDYMDDDMEETPEARIEDFQDHLIQALEEHIEEFTDDTTSYERRLTY
jgi:hypothetical protein